MIENKDRMIMQAKVYKDHDEVEDCTFKPNMMAKKSKWSRKEEKRRAVSQMDDSSMVPPPRFEELYEKNKAKLDKLQNKRDE